MGLMHLAMWMYFFMNATDTILSVFFLELPCSKASYFSQMGVSSSSSLASRSLVVRMSASPSMAKTSPSCSLGPRYRCIRTTWSAIFLSLSTSIWSSMMNRQSKRESKESCKPMFSMGDLYMSYLPHTGLAAARTQHRALSRAWIPALEIVTRPCSMTSWIAVLSRSVILSNSSIQTMPLSAKTMAPASSLLSPDSWSVVTAAVRPTPEEPRPVVVMARGAVCSTYLRSCDFATLGSPMRRILTSPLSLVPLGRFFSTPPRSMHRRAFLMYSWPWMDGARDLDSMSK